MDKNPMMTADIMHQNAAPYSEVFQLITAPAQIEMEMMPQMKAQQMHPEPELPVLFRL